MADRLGMGKTLTAGMYRLRHVILASRSRQHFSPEILSVRTGKPLYSISMSDVGLSQSRLETNLLRIFDLGGNFTHLGTL